MFCIICCSASLNQDGRCFDVVQKDGVLTEEQVASCLSNLGHSATGLQHVYQFLSIPVKHLYISRYTLHENVTYRYGFIHRSPQPQL